MVVSATTALEVLSSVPVVASVVEAPAALVVADSVLSEAFVKSDSVFLFVASVLDFSVSDVPDLDASDLDEVASVLTRFSPDVSAVLTVSMVLVSIVEVASTEEASGTDAVYLLQPEAVNITVATIRAADNLDKYFVNILFFLLCRL